MIKHMQTIYDNFEKEQAKLRKEYLESGMSEECIQKMYDFDKAQLARDIAYNRRSVTFELDTEALSSLDKNPLLKDFKHKFSSELDFSFADKYFWIEEISDEKLAKRLKKLSEEDLELLNLYIINQLTQSEIAKYYGINQKNISKKIKRIKEFLI